MKKILLSCIMLAGIVASAQVTGSKTIGVDYPTLNDAFTDLNTNGVGAGGATINVPAGYMETAPAGGYLLGSATLNASLSSTNPLFIKKSGSGANPIFTAQVGTVAISAANLIGDAIFSFSGVDYMTVDGLDLKESAANLDATTLVEKGFAFYNLSPTDGANYNTVQNSTITFLKGVNNNATGIFFGHNAIATPATAVIPTSADGTNSNNKVYSNTITKSLANAISFTGFAAPTPFTLYDQNNDIGGSSIDTANTITDFGGLAGGSFFITNYAVYAVYQNNANVSNNTIQFSSDGLGTVGIYVFGTNSTFTTNNNTINAVGASYSTTSLHTGIYSNAAGTNLTANNNKINIASGVPFSGTVGVSGINFPGTGSLTATGNTIIGGTSPGTFYGIYSGALTAINISNNKISGLISSGASANVSGIYLAVTAANGTISGNKISDLSSKGATASAYGINVLGGAAATTTTIFNNLIGDIKTPASSNATISLAGINLASTGANSKLNVYYNTIKLSGTSTGANFNSAGISHVNNNTATTATLDLRNNIISNTSTPNGTGIASAFRRSAAGVSNYAATSDNNDFFGTSFVYLNGNTGSSLADLQALSRDANSLNVKPSFISGAGADADFLKINPADLNTQLLDNKAAPLAAILTDYAGVTRNAATPDLGAYEFTYSAPTTAPDCTVITSPVNNATGVSPNPAAISWSNAPRATSYKLSIGTVSGISDVVNVSGLTDLTYNANLASNTMYYATVTASNSLGDAVSCTEISFKTGNYVYCSAAGANASFEKITNLTFADISNPSSADGTATGYEDFTAIVGHVRRESSYTFTADCSVTNYASDQVLVWIDFNQNGSFNDAGELVLSTALGKAPWTGPIAIPADAKLGDTRMRVRIQDNSSGPNTTSCGVSNYGQVEDYTINIDSALATSQSSTKSTVSVYPNPFQDVLKISDVKGVKSISISDVSGRQVKTMKPSTELNLSDLKTGLYIVTLQMEDGTFKSIKAIKK